MFVVPVLAFALGAIDLRFLPFFFGFLTAGLGTGTDSSSAETSKLNINFVCYVIFKFDKPPSPSNMAINPEL